MCSASAGPAQRTQVCTDTSWTCASGTHCLLGIEQSPCRCHSVLHTEPIGPLRGEQRSHLMGLKVLEMEMHWVMGMGLVMVMGWVTEMDWVMGWDWVMGREQGREKGQGS